MKAIIFDMDGVVMDSEKHWDAKEFELFKKLVPGWNPEKHKQVIGLNTHDTFAVLKKTGLKMPEKEFTERVGRLAMGIYRNQAEAMPGFLGLAEEIKKAGIPMSLASSSRFTWIDCGLKKLGLEKYFETIASAEEVKGPGKPAPGIYLLAAKKIGFSPAECVAIEDSANGVKAAKAAGMFTVGFRNGTNDDQDHSSADMDIKGFTPENNQKILKLFKR